MLLPPKFYRRVLGAWQGRLCAALCAVMALLALGRSVVLAAGAYHGTYVYDTFDRRISRGWGDAGMGGTYTIGTVRLCAEKSAVYCPRRNVNVCRMVRVNTDRFLSPR